MALTQITESFLYGKDLDQYMQNPYYVGPLTPETTSFIKNRRKLHLFECTCPDKVKILVNIDSRMKLIQKMIQTIAILKEKLQENYEKHVKKMEQINTEEYFKKLRAAKAAKERQCMQQQAKQNEFVEKNDCNNESDGDEGDCDENTDSSSACDLTPKTIPCNKNRRMCSGGLKQRRKTRAEYDRIIRKLEGKCDYYKPPTSAEKKSKCSNSSKLNSIKSPCTNTSTTTVKSAKDNDSKRSRQYSKRSRRSSRSSSVRSQNIIFQDLLNQLFKKSEENSAAIETGCIEHDRTVARNISDHNNAKNFERMKTIEKLINSYKLKMNKNEMNDDTNSNINYYDENNTIINELLEIQQQSQTKIVQSINNILDSIIETNDKTDQKMDREIRSLV